MTVHASPRDACPHRRGTATILGAALFMFAILDIGMHLLAPHHDDHLSRVLLAGIMLGVALAVERFAFGRDPRAALRTLGYARPPVRALVMGALIAALVLAYFPAAVLLGAGISLRHDWLWVLAGAVALNGFAEETLVRGFLFGHLRAQPRTFRNALALSMAVFVAAHIPVFLTNHPGVGAVSMLVALTSSIAYAYLFERGDNTIWALVVLHTSTHAIRLFDQAEAMPLLLGWMLLQAGAPFLVFLFRSYLENVPRRHSAAVQAPAHGCAVSA